MVAYQQQMCHLLPFFFIIIYRLDIIWCTLKPKADGCFLSGAYLFLNWPTLMERANLQHRDVRTLFNNNTEHQQDVCHLLISTTWAPSYIMSHLFRTIDSEFAEMSYNDGGCLQHASRNELLHHVSFITDVRDESGACSVLDLPPALCFPVRARSVQGRSWRLPGLLQGVPLPQLHGGELQRGGHIRWDPLPLQGGRAVVPCEGGGGSSSGGGGGVNSG